MTDSINATKSESEKPKNRPDHTALILNLIQAFGVIFALILALIQGDNLRERSAVALSAYATVLLLYTFLQAMRKWRHDRPWAARAVWQGAAAVILIVAAGLIYSPDPADRIANRTSSPPTARRPFIEKKGYVLRRSSSIATNDQDKIDLDTACPGWGDMHPRIGPSRCGGTADLILDQEGVHTADDKPALIELNRSSGNDLNDCQNAFAARPVSSVSQIEVGNLRAKDQICAATDLNNIALVRVSTVSTDGRDQLEQLTIDFAVWRTQDS